MRLVGATNWFIRWPFVIGGPAGRVLRRSRCGRAAVAREGDRDRPLGSDRFALIAAPETVEFGLLVVVLLAAATAVSALGSGITLRRFLRV